MNLSNKNMLIIGYAFSIIYNPLFYNLLNFSLLLDTINNLKNNFLTVKLTKRIMS